MDGENMKVKITMVRRKIARAQLKTRYGARWETMSTQKQEEKIDLLLAKQDLEKESRA